MNENEPVGAIRRGRKLRRIAVAAVSAVMLFGLADMEAGVAQAAVTIMSASPTASAVLSATIPPGPCDPDEVGQEKAGLDGKMYVCEPVGQAGVADTEADGKGDGKRGAEATTEEQRLGELASDPAQGGAITPGTLQEARAALGLEKSGELPAPVRRDPTGAADFIDGRDRLWDVKNFNSNFPPSQGGYELTDSMTKINRELQLGENVIVST